MSTLERKATTTTAMVASLGPRRCSSVIFIVIALLSFETEEARAFGGPRTTTTTTRTTLSPSRHSGSDCARSVELHPLGWQKATTTTLSSSSFSSSSLSSSSSSSSSLGAAEATLFSPSRSGAGTALDSWAQASGIKVGGVRVVGPRDGSVGGLGLASDRTLKPGDVVVQVPTDLTLQVESEGGYDVDRDVEVLLGGGRGGGGRPPREVRRAAETSPWWVRMSLKVNAIDKVTRKIGGRSRGEGGVDATPWLDSLPRDFDTPFHWSDDQLSELQYQHLSDAVRMQRIKWKARYNDITSKAAHTDLLSFDNFVWGCETARSRCFSGPRSGTGAFDPKPYALTLVLIAAYVGGGFGTLEQASNGAALVLCGTVLKDFVLPKFLGRRKYVLCPYIDMANHDGTGSARGVVAFEYFSDGYSLSVSEGGIGSPIPDKSELFITYGPRSNDQLLQYYGFVERGNPHDVYVMPPLREWDVAALEKATDRTIGPGRLEKLDRAGLLGKSQAKDDAAVVLASTDDEDNIANAAGGVVVTRTSGIDPAAIQVLRALLSTDEEWSAAGESIGNFAGEESGGLDNERAALVAARTAMELELKSKPTTRADDEDMLRKMDLSESARVGGIEERLAVMFRAEKKRVLEEAIDNIQVSIKAF